MGDGKKTGCRRAVLEINDQLFLQFFMAVEIGFAGIFRVMENGLPLDAKPIRMWSNDYGTYSILIESERFEPVLFGEEYPVLPEIRAETVGLNEVKVD